MAIPTGGYDSATISNPSSALTDFSLLVDLSEMSSDWWDEVDTSDGTRGRASKSDGTTELACDWIDFDNTGETGLLRVLFSGSLASSGTQTIRIYPPNTDNAAVAASATYGSDNAYDDGWDGYWPNGGGSDRTSNGRDGTAGGGVTVGGATGQLGDATEFDGTDDNIDLGAGWLSDYDDLLVLVWVKPDSADDGERAYVASWASGNFLLEQNSTDFTGVIDDNAYRIASGGTPTTSWQSVGLRFDSVDVDVYHNATAVANQTSNSDMWPLTSNIRIGSSNNSDKYFDGLLQEVQIHSDSRSADWIEHEYDQVDDNATFWGTWTWTSGSTGVTISATAAIEILGEANLLPETTISPEAALEILGSAVLSVDTPGVTISASGQLVINGEAILNPGVTVSPVGALIVEGDVVLNPTTTLSPTASVDTEVTFTPTNLAANISASANLIIYISYVQRLVSETVGVLRYVFFKIFNRGIFGGKQR